MPEIDRVGARAQPTQGPERENSRHHVRVRVDGDGDDSRRRGARQHEAAAVEEGAGFGEPQEKDGKKRERGQSANIQHEAGAKPLLPCGAQPGPPAKRERAAKQKAHGACVGAVVDA